MKKRRILAIVLAVVMTAGLAACAGDGGATPTPAAPTAPDTSAAGQPAGDVGAFEGLDPITINFAHVVSVNSPKGWGAERFRELMEERTGGLVTVHVFPDSQMGTDREITEQMMMDVLHMNAPLTSVLTFIIPEFEVFDLPYLFDSREMAFDAVHGSFGAEFDELIAQNSMVNLGWWMGEFMQIANNVRPLYTVEDLAGLQLRVSQSPILLARMEAVANAVSIPFAEVYSALQTGVADGLDNPLTNIVNRSFYEVADYVAIMDLSVVMYPVLMSRGMYDSLPDPVRELVHEVLAEIAAEQWVVSLESEMGYIGYLESAGVTITYWSAEERARLLEAMSPAFDVFVNNVERGEHLLQILENYR